MQWCKARHHWTLDQFFGVTNHASLSGNLMDESDGLAVARKTVFVWLHCAKCKVWRESRQVREYFWQCSVVILAAGENRLFTFIQVTHLDIVRTSCKPFFVCRAVYKQPVSNDSSWQIPCSGISSTPYPERSALYFSPQANPLIVVIQL